MKIILENNIEKTYLNDEILAKIKEVIGHDVHIDLIEADIFLSELQSLGWNMGEKKYYNREDLYDR